MPHTSNWWGLMLELYRSHKTSFDIFLLVVLGVIVRVFYWGGKLREAVMISLSEQRLWCLLLLIFLISHLKYRS